MVWVAFREGSGDIAWAYFNNQGTLLGMMLKGNPTETTLTSLTEKSMCLTGGFLFDLPRHPNTPAGNGPHFGFES